MNKRDKTLVGCIYLNKKDGTIEPISIIYEEKEFYIDKFKFLGQRAAKYGGSGLCWEVLIHGQKRYLFKDFYYNVFFVEK